MFRKAFRKLVYGIKTKLHETGKRQELLAVDHRVDMLRGGEGPPLLYLHSLVGETHWLPFHHELSKGFEVIAPAHPGFGETVGLDEIDTMEDVVFHYLDVLDGLGLERAHLVGVSLGGWIAAEIAVRYPERVDRLVLADAFGLHVDGASPPEALLPALADPAALRPLLFADPKSYAADIALPARGEADPRRLTDGAADAGSLVERLGGFEDPKLARRLRRITSPTLVLWGDRDPLLSLAHAEAYRDMVRRAELRVLRDCGHLPQFERGPEFVAAVRDFLS